MDLGYRDYAQTWQIQQDLVQNHIDGRGQDTLILVEHPPVFTRGTSARNSPLAPLPYPIHDVERGGDITYHGPGQLVGYPILNLQERGMKVGTYLRKLEAVLIESVGRFKLIGERKPKWTGVWCQGKKVASIGVALRGWISYHGFALNVCCDLNAFQSIKPCGLNPEIMTSLSALLGREVSVDEARDCVEQAFMESFTAKDYN